MDKRDYFFVIEYICVIYMYIKMYFINFSIIFIKMIIFCYNYNIVY